MREDQTTEATMEETNIISCYTRQNAIDDGIFVDVSEVAKEAGFKIPVAITTNLYHTYIKPSEEAKNYGQDEQGRLWDVLWLLRVEARKTRDSFLKYKVRFQDSPSKKKDVTVWAVCEATSPTDPSPAINIMLPEDM